MSRTTAVDGTQEERATRPPMIGSWSPPRAQELRHLQRAAGNRAVGRLLQRGSKKPRGGVETTEVVPEIRRLLDAKQIKYATEVTFELLDDSGNAVLRGRLDFFFRDPSNGQAVIPEAKGLDLEKLTTNQTDYVPRLESETGARIRITSHKGGHLNLPKGSIEHITGANFLRIGRAQLKDFASALEEVTTGERVKYSFRDAEGLRYFKTEAEFDEFLATKGIQRVVPRDPALGGRPAATPPVEDSADTPKAAQPSAPKSSKAPAPAVKEDFVTRVARGSGLRVRKQGGFATIGGMAFAVMAVGTVYIIIDSVRANGLVETAKGLALAAGLDAALTLSIMRFGKVGLGRASPLGALVMLEGDNPAQIEMKRRQRLVDDLIHDAFPDVLTKVKWCDPWFGLLCTDWEYEVADVDRYPEIRDAVERLVDHPFELELDTDDIYAQQPDDVGDEPTHDGCEHPPDDVPLDCSECGGCGT